MCNNRKESLCKEYNNIIGKQEQVQAKYDQVQIATKLLWVSLQELEKQKAALQAQKELTEAELDKSVMQEKKAAALYNDAKSRLKLLTDMQRQFEGVSQGIKSILNRNAAWRPSICGAVAQI